ncbi:hypothetical protein C496_09776 [Natronorubrum tibetense GA33]|uniref:Uncharacterized protein n=1 Tax=Natronorubrum tibetense GA33 TaxID=1114856 RepID=L9VYC6_9EURY|nr:hypothetical protein C496_09776 [Natronorubrum tibetense GA33]
MGIATFIREALTTTMNVVRLTAIAGAQYCTLVRNSLDIDVSPFEGNSSGVIEWSHAFDRQITGMWSGTSIGQRLARHRVSLYYQRM